MVTLDYAGAAHAKRHLRFVRARDARPEAGLLHLRRPRRALCPIILGHTRGQEKALTFQVGGGSRSGLPPGGEWRCLWLSKVSNAELHDGPWFDGAGHTRPQDCVEIVDLDVNPLSPYPPKGSARP